MNTHKYIHIRKNVKNKMSCYFFFFNNNSGNDRFLHIFFIFRKKKSVVFLFQIKAPHVELIVLGSYLIYKYTTNVNVGHCLREHLAWYEVTGYRDWAARGPIRKADWGSFPIDLHTITPADMLSHIHTWLSPPLHLSPADRHHGPNGCPGGLALGVWAQLQRSGAPVVPEYFYQSFQFIRRHHAGRTLSHQHSHQQPHPEDGARQHQLPKVSWWYEGATEL